MEKKPGKNILRGVMLIVCAALLVTAAMKYNAELDAKEAELRRLEDAATAIFESYDLQNIEANVTGPGEYDGYDLYCLNVTATGVDDVGYIYARGALQETEALSIALDDSLLLCSFKLDGERYSISVDGSILYRGLEQVYPTWTPSGKISTSGSSDSGSSGSSGHSSAHHSKDGSGSEDGSEYDVSLYSNAEDFYYDHYDDFFDYEDAEDYFDEHYE